MNFISEYTHNLVKRRPILIKKCGKHGGVFRQFDVFWLGEGGDFHHKC